MFLALSPKGGKNSRLEEFYFSCALLVTFAWAATRGSASVGPLWCAGPGRAVNAASSRLPGRCPARVSAAAVFVVLARRAPSFFPAFPGCSLPDLGCPARRALGPSQYPAAGPPRFEWHRVGALRLSPAAPPAAPVPLLELSAASSPAQTPSWVPYARCGLPPCTRCHLFPLPWTRHRRAAAWPAEGPVGPEMWLCQGGERPTGREALQVYPVLKENKTFSWETFPLCFSPPAHFSCSLLLGCLPGSAPCLLSLETPSRSQGCGSESGLPGAQAVQRLARPCMPSLQPLPHPLGQREGQRLAVWLQVRGESRWPVSQLCLCAVQAQPWVCSPGFRHTLGSSAPLCSARSPCCQLLLSGKIGSTGWFSGSWLPSFTATPVASLSFSIFSLLFVPPGKSP